MITLQHTLVTLFGLRGNVQKLEEELEYVLLPDAIRRYLAARQYSHFEKHPNGKDVSWFKYPLDLKTLTRAEAFNQPKYLAANIPPSVLGEKSSIPTFELHNGHLPPKYFAGVKKHLTQDIEFDNFIRANIDTSKKFRNEFYFKDQLYDGKEIRKVIAEISEHGVYVLAYMLHKSFGLSFTGKKA